MCSTEDPRPQYAKTANTQKSCCVARQRTVLHSAERIQRPQQPRRTDTQRTRSYESEMVYWTEKAPAASDGQEAEPRAEEEL